MSQALSTNSRRLPSERQLRVVIVAESFLPDVNGVTNSVLRTIEHLREADSAVLVIAPGPGPDHHEEVPVLRVRSFDVPRYENMRVGLPLARLTHALKRFAPDVMHLAAPTILGAAGLRAARRLGIPTVAVFQTDLAGFAKRNGLGRMSESVWQYLRWIHAQADRTLAPSTSTSWALRARGVDDVRLWPRGVDLAMFHPDHRSDDLRRVLAPGGETIVGYVGRLAREKQVERLAALSELDDCRLVIVGDGPERASLERALPTAHFVGFQSGHDLGRITASLDVFVHTGLDETFCQTVQESMASGVAVVGPASGGPLDLIRHGQTGYLWSPESPESLAGAVADLCDRPELRKQMGRAARHEAEQRPWPVVMEQLDAHYADVIRARRVDRRGRRGQVA